MTTGLGQTSVPAWAFWAGAAGLVALIGAVIWYAIPDPDARHRFVSPSGRMALDVGERCGEAGCVRVIISEETAPDGTRTRLGCTVPLTQDRPVLPDARPLWAADERSVDIVYADAQGRKAGSRSFSPKTARTRADGKAKASSPPPRNRPVVPCAARARAPRR